MKILCSFGRYAYGDAARGDSYEYANFLPAFEHMGHEVVLFDSFDRSRWADFAELNRDFLACVERERPDVIFCVLMGYELWRETLVLAKAASGACLINWATDDSWKYEEFSRHVAGAFDIYATTYRSAMDKALRDGYRHFSRTQWAAASSLLRAPRPAGECRYAVSFIGAAYGNRRQWVAALRQRGIEVRCFGHGWPGGVVCAEELPCIVNESIITLNFGDSGLVLQGARLARSRQIKARVFEVPAAGGCLLTESAQGLDEYFVCDEEIMTFDDIDDLAAKIRALLDAPQQRDRMAWAGHERVRRDHTYEVRLAHLMASSLSLMPSAPASVAIMIVP